MTETTPELTCPNCLSKLKETFVELPRVGATGVAAMQCMTGDYEVYQNISIEGERSTIYEVFVFPNVRVRLGKAYTVFGERTYGLTYQYRMKVDDLKRIGNHWNALRNLL